MGYVDNDGAVFYYKGNKGKCYKLLDSLDYYNNYTIRPMHILSETDNGIQGEAILGKMILSVKDDIYKKCCNNEIDFMIFLRIINKILQNNLPCNILYISSRYNKNIEYITAINEYFNSKGKVYWLTNEYKKISDNRIISICTNFNDIILPANQFDIIVVDDVTDYSMWSEMIEILITSSRDNGLLISYTNNDDILLSMKEIFSNMINYDITQDQYLQEAIVDTSIKENIKNNTREYAVLSVKNVIDENLQEIENNLDNTSRHKYDELIAVVVELEKYARQINCYLSDRDFKYRLNLLKENMINYRLGICDLENVKKSFENINRRII